MNTVSTSPSPSGSGWLRTRVFGHTEPSIAFGSKIAETQNAGLSEDHQLLLHKGLDEKMGVRYRPTHKGAIDLAIEHLLDQLTGCAGPKGEVDSGIGCNEFGEDRGQMNRRGRLKRANH